MNNAVWEELHIGRMTEEDLKARAGKVAHLKSEISLSGEETEVRRHAFCLFTRKESGKVDPHTIWDTIVNLKYLIRQNGLTQIYMEKIESESKDVKWFLVKKMLEYHFGGTDIEVLACVGKTRTEAESKSWAQAARNGKEAPSLLSRRTKQK